MENGTFDQEDGELTTIGRICTGSTALEPSLGRLIAFGYLFGLIEESIIMGNLK